MRLPCLLATALLLLPAAGLAKKDEPAMPMHREPRHELVLETPQLRIVDVRLPPGDRTLFHHHSDPGHYVLVEATELRAQPSGGDWAPAGPPPGVEAVAGAAWTDDARATPYTHRVENVGDDPMRLIAVINRSSRPFADDTSPSDLPGEAETGDRWFHRSRLTLRPGETTRWHRTDSPLVVIQVGYGQIELLDSSGRSSSFGAPGDWLLVESAGAYRLRNGGERVLELVVVEPAP